HGDAGRAVDQQVREPGRHDRGLQFLLVVVGLEVDRLLVDVGHQLVAQARHARLGVAHGRGRVAVDRTEVALAVHQHVAERERLRHAHQGVVHRLVAMRVVLADHVADDARRLVVGHVAVRDELVHRVTAAPVDRPDAVADVGARAAPDTTHDLLEVAAAPLVLEVDWDYFLADLGHRDPFEGGSGSRFRAPRTGYAGGRTEVTDSITSRSLTQAGYVLKSMTCAAPPGLARGASGRDSVHARSPGRSRPVPDDAGPLSGRARGGGGPAGTAAAGARAAAVGRDRDRARHRTDGLRVAARKRRLDR